MAVRQLSVFIENKQGRLSEVLKGISESDVNIRALSIGDSEDGHRQFARRTRIGGRHRHRALLRLGLDGKAVHVVETIIPHRGRER